jgi:hypothetical protein
MAKALVGTKQIKECMQLVNSLKKQSQTIPHLELLVEKYDGNRALLRRYRPLDPPHEHAQQNRDWMAGMQTRLKMERPAIEKAKRTVRVWQTNSAKISRLAPDIAGWCSDKKTRLRAVALLCSDVERRSSGGCPYGAGSSADPSRVAIRRVIFRLLDSH